MHRGDGGGTCRSFPGGRGVAALWSLVRPRRTRLLSLWLAVVVVLGCGEGSLGPGDVLTSPEHDRKYGIYALNPASGAVRLIYSSDNPLQRMDLDGAGARLVFEEDFGGDLFHGAEICVMDTGGAVCRRLTDNSWLDAYPCWSPDGRAIMFLSWPDYPANTMDIYVMDAEGGAREEFYDSGFHDGDCDWVGSQVVFTRESRIWIMESDGTDVRQVTDYDLAGYQGNADLPFGDYDPRLNPSGTLICFDRMVDDRTRSGNYDFYSIVPDGTEETALTGTGWQQFMAEWSHGGDRLLFTVAAADGEGIYDMYVINADGTGATDITPAAWPPEFLCTHGIFSSDDSTIYFTGEWYKD
jgi:Tol biopolymer transport system component